MMKQKWEVTSAGLHLIAMAAMLCDHVWRALISGNSWMNCVGRIAFPIFAFLLVEGYFHTHDVKRYAFRLFVCAVLSEVPFDLVMSGQATDWSYQNVLWTLLIGLGLVYLNDEASKTGNVLEQILVSIATVILAILVGSIVQADYGSIGLLMILLFYFFHGNGLFCKIAQFFGLLILCILLGSVQQGIRVGHTLLVFPRQIFAVAALIPIWLYHGRQGYHDKWFQYVCYGFYPVHLLTLGVIAFVM